MIAVIAVIALDLCCVFPTSHNDYHVNYMHFFANGVRYGSAGMSTDARIEGYGLKNDRNIETFRCSIKTDSMYAHSQRIDSGTAYFSKYGEGSLTLSRYTSYGCPTDSLSLSIDSSTNAIVGHFSFSAISYPKISRHFSDTTGHSYFDTLVDTVQIADGIFVYSSDWMWQH